MDEALIIKFIRPNDLSELKIQENQSDLPKSGFSSQRQWETYSDSLYILKFFWLHIAWNSNERVSRWFIEY